MTLLIKKRKNSLAYKTLLVAFSLIFISAQASAGDEQNIITSVVSAPVVTNGLVAGEPTEFNIMLNSPEKNNDVALDAKNFGHQIPAGGWLELELGGSFSRNVDGAGDPVVHPIRANANIILTTGPQSPIVAGSGAGVQHGNWSVMDDGNNIIKIIPNGGKGKNGLEGKRAKKIGFKVVHLRPNNGANPVQAVYYNGPAGSVGSIALRIYNDEGEIKESGYADVVFQPNVGRQVHFTNAGLTTGKQGSPATISTELDESTLFQHVAAGTMLTTVSKHVPFSDGAPYAPRFLLFESLENNSSFIPQTGIANVDYMVDMDRPWVAMLKENDEVIGAIVMTGPSADSRGMILPSLGMTQLGGNGSVLNVPVKVGDKPGIYKVMVSLISGGSAVNTIIVED